MKQNGWRTTPPTGCFELTAGVFSPVLVEARTTSLPEEADPRIEILAGPNAGHFEAGAGVTGEPFVDANMIELKETGFASNRGRQNVASFSPRT